MTYLLIISLLIVIALMPIIGFAIIKPNGKFYCHVPGCGRSFDTINEIIKHLKIDHNYNNKELKQYQKNLQIHHPSLS
jgi:hypothetical protein